MRRMMMGALLTILAGCAAQVGESSQALAISSMNRDAIESSTFYVADAFAAPLLAAEVIELGLEDEAEPVAVVFHPEAGYAVAWAASAVIFISASTIIG